VLLAGTAIVYRQLTYIKNMNLGFDKSNFVIYAYDRRDVE
jgi:hypothetical protein